MMSCMSTLKMLSSCPSFDYKKGLHQVLSWSFNAHFVDTFSEDRVHHTENKAPVTYLPIWCTLLFVCGFLAREKQLIQLLLVLNPSVSIPAKKSPEAQQVSKTTDMGERSSCLHWPRKKNPEDSTSKLNWIWLLSVYIIHTGYKNDKGCTCVQEDSEDLNAFWRNKVNEIFAEDKAGLEVCNSWLSSYKSERWSWWCLLEVGVKT